MYDVVDRISDQDDAETARKQNVGSKNNIVFNSLVNAFRDRIAKYNERHPQGAFFPNALVMSAGPISGSSGMSTESELKVKKNIAPLSELTLNFPINDGAMRVEITSSAGKFAGTITLDIVNDTPTYDLDGKRYSAETLADLLLEPVLSSTGSFSSGRKFGFV